MNGSLTLDPKENWVTPTSTSDHTKQRARARCIGVLFFFLVPDCELIIIELPPHLRLTFHKALNDDSDCMF